AEDSLLAGLPSAAREVAEFLAGRGASFLPEIARGTGRLPAEVEDALWDLVSAGLVSGDGVAGLRLLLGRNKPPPRHARLRAVPGGRSGAISGVSGRGGPCRPAAGRSGGETPLMGSGRIRVAPQESEASSRPDATSWWPGNCSAATALSSATSSSGSATPRRGGCSCRSSAASRPGAR